MALGRVLEGDVIRVTADEWHGAMFDLSDAALAVHVRALAYCAASGDTVLPLVWFEYVGVTVAVHVELVQADLWTYAPDGYGFEVLHPEHFRAAAN